MVRLTGFEPVAYGFVDHRSIQLSYSRTGKIIANACSECQCSHALRRRGLHTMKTRW